MEHDSVKEMDVLVIGGGTAGTNAARQAAKDGARNVLVVHTKELTNTCIEAGCMPSKSILAGSHAGLATETIAHERDQHIERLLKALCEGLDSESFEMISGDAHFEPDGTVTVAKDGEKHSYRPQKTIIASGSTPFVPPVPGLESLGERMLVSDDIVSRNAALSDLPRRILILGGGPIGLELGTFLHEIGKQVVVVEMSEVLGIFDPEFGEERVRASEDEDSFLIRTYTILTNVEKTETGVVCTLEKNGEPSIEEFDAILVATGRKPNTDTLGLENTDVAFDERRRIKHNEYLETDHEGIFIAGDVAGHHQILHFAAEMGKTAGHNAAKPDEKRELDYDKFMLAVAFDQFPSALIGITETEAKKRGMEVTTATRYFNSIGRGILDRQMYGMWKLVAEKKTGIIIGAQVLGPKFAGELMQIVVPLIHNENTYGDVLQMPWYHPTYGEIVKSLANDMCDEDDTFCPGMD